MGTQGRRARLARNGQPFDHRAPAKAIHARQENWGARFEHEPKWGKHMLPEPDELVRELKADEADAITMATRPDYEPFIAFARATGLRLRECLVKWSEVDWQARKVIKKGKGGRIVTAHITNEVEPILRSCDGHHPVFVFTYIVQRPRDGRVKGKRVPITYNGAKSEWRSTRNSLARRGFPFPRFPARPCDQVAP